MLSIQFQGLKVFWITTVLLAAVFAGAELKAEEAAQLGLDTPKPLPIIYGDLRGLLGGVAEAYRLPLVAVLAGPSKRMKLPAGTFPPRQVLDLLVEKYPDYSWQVRDSVVYFYHRVAKEDPKNMLNWRIPRFTISDTVADIEMRLRANLNKIWKGVKGEGGVMVGIPSSGFEKHVLSKIVLHDVTGEEILLKVASIDRRFFSILAYPTPPPIGDDDIYRAFLNWDWVAFPAEE